MILSDLEKEKIREITFATNMELGGKKYFVKQTSRYEFEMLGLVLARLLDIKSPNCTIINIEKPYIVSEDLNNFGNFYLMEEVNNIESNTIAAINKSLSDIDIEEIIKMYLYDIIFQNCDRNKANYGIVENELYIIDNESIFDLFDIPIITASDYEIITLDVNSEIYMNVMKYEISTFLLNFKEYNYMLKKILNKINPYKLMLISKELGIKNQDFLNFFNDVYNEILKMMEFSRDELKIINKKSLESDVKNQKLIKKLYTKY